MSRSNSVYKTPYDCFSFVQNVKCVKFKVVDNESDDKYVYKCLSDEENLPCPERKNNDGKVLKKLLKFIYKLYVATTIIAII